MAIPRKSRTPPSPAPASGNSKTASSNKASQNSGAPVPGVLLGLSGGWLVARMFFFGGTLWLIEIIAISVAAGFVYPKGGKVQKRFATAIIAVALLNLFVPGINPRIKSLRESQLNPPPPTEQSVGQEEQVAPPSPTPEVWDSTQFSDRGGIILDKPSQEIFIPLDSELCISELIDPDTGGNLLQRVTVGTDEYNTRMSQCWDISPGKISILVGHPEGAVIEDEYKRFGGKLPVIRPK